MRGRRGRREEGREGGREIEREGLRGMGREKSWREAEKDNQDINRGENALLEKVKGSGIILLVKELTSL